MVSLVLLVPANLQDLANQIAAALDFGPNTFSVALSDSGVPPATYFGARTDATDTFVAWLEACKGGNYPVIQNVAAQQIESVFTNLYIDASNQMQDREHFDSVLTKKNWHEV